MLRTLALAVVLASFSHLASATEWSGGAGTGPEWSKGTNWVGGSAPINGSGGIAEFLTVRPRMDSMADAAWQLNTLRFAGVGLVWDLSGSPLTMVGPTDAVIDVQTTTTLINPLTLDVNTTLTNVPDLTLYGIGGVGNLTKQGAGALTIDPALGGLNGTGGLIVKAGSVLASPVSGNNALTIDSGALVLTNAGNWAALNGQGTVGLTGTVGFNGTASTFYGTIIGTGRFDKRGSGFQILAGNNAWSGGTTIQPGAQLVFGDGVTGNVPNVPTTVDGTLSFNVPGSSTLTTVSGTGGVTLNNSAVTGGAWNLGSADLIVAGTGSLSLGSLTCTCFANVLGAGASWTTGASTVGGIFGDGTITTSGNLDVDVTGSSSSFSGTITGSGTLRKLGTGYIFLGGSVTTVGQTVIEAGALFLQPGANLGAGVHVKSGATLRGSGALGNLKLAGELYPLLDGTVPIVQYDRITVTGTVDLTGATLVINNASTYTPVAGNVFTLIDNDGSDPVIGTFAGLPEGALIDRLGTKLRISYVGGTGNDVTLTFVPQFQVLSSAGANGSITPSGNQVVITGTVLTFTVAANSGYVTVMSGSCGGNLVGTTFTTNAVTGNCTVFANFQALVTYNLVAEGWQQVSPYVATPASGVGTAVFNPVAATLTLNLSYSGLTSAETMAHIHGPAFRGSNANVIFTLAPGSPKADVVTLTAAQQTMLQQGELYVNIHTSTYPNGELRAQIDNNGTTFRRDLTVVKAGTGSGTVTGTAEPGTVINCGSDCTETVPLSKSVQVNATPAAGSMFAGWSGACTGTAPCNITMDAPKTVTATFTADPPRLGNISTRMQVLTGNDVMIGGFVVGGAASKRLAIVATGPSLAQYGIVNPLANPTLTLVRSSDQSVIASNDDWQTAANSAQLTAAGFAPTNSLEAALLVDLPPGAYTAIVSGVSNGTGVAVIGVYEVDHPEIPLVNISTRGQVLTGNDVMIGGFVIQGSASQTVAIVATGPSLAAFGITNALANPTLTLVRSSDQAVLATNDDWQSDVNATQLQNAGFAPSNALEAALYVTLPPGAYTAIVSGVGGGTGVGVIGVYKVN